MTKEELFPRTRYPKRKRAEFTIPGKHFSMRLEVYAEKSVYEHCRQALGEYTEFKSSSGERQLLLAKEVSPTNRKKYYIVVSGDIVAATPLQYELALEEFFAGLARRHGAKTNDDRALAVLQDALHRADWEEF